MTEYSNQEYQNSLLYYIYIVQEFLTPTNIASMITVCQKKILCHETLLLLFSNMSSKQKQIDNDVKGNKKARTLPCTHLSTTSSHMNNITPNVMLDALGLNPVIEMPWSGGATCHPRTSVIEFAIVKELEQFLIFLFCPRCATSW